MNLHINVHVDKETEIRANKELLNLELEDVTLHFGSSEGRTARPEAVAAITDKMIEQLMVVREAALRQAVREGDKRVAIGFVDWALRKEARASVALDHDPNLETQSSLSPMLEGSRPPAADEDYVRGLGRPPTQLPIDKDLEEATKADHELMADEFHGRGIDGSL